MPTGFSFPFGASGNGDPGMASDAELVRSSIMSILGIAFGEVPMSDAGLEFNAHSLVFENITPIMKARLSKSIRVAIELGEPRARVRSVTVEESPGQNGSMVIASITYEVSGVIDEVSVPLT